MGKELFKKIVSFLVILILIFSISACGNLTSSNNTEDTDEKNLDAESVKEQDTKELKKVVIGVMGDDGFMTESALIAQKEEFFEKELEKAGYYPEYVGFAGAGPALNEAFAAGEIDVAFYSELPAITAKSAGINIKIIASSSSEQKYALSVADNSGINSVEDLIGKKIVVPFGTAVYRYVTLLLDEHGISLEDVELVNSATDGPSMLTAGEVDAFATSYSLVLTYETSGIGMLLEDSISNYNQESAFVLAAQTEFLAENEQAAIALIKALNHTYEFSVENPTAAIEDSVKDTTTLEIQTKVYSDTSFSYFNPEIDSQLIQRIKDVISFSKENEIISNDVDVNALIDTSYYKKAVLEE